MRWKGSSSLILLAVRPTAFGRALLSSEIEIPHEIHTQPLPTRIRSTSRAGDKIKGRSITRRGQCACKGLELVNEDEYDDCMTHMWTSWDDCSRNLANDVPSEYEWEYCEDDQQSETCQIEALVGLTPSIPMRHQELAVPRDSEWMEARGKKGLDLVANPVRGEDFLDKMKKNYVISMLNAAKWMEKGIGTNVHELYFFDEYGFDRKSGWTGMWVHSKGNIRKLVVEMNIGKATKDGKDYVAIVAHERFAAPDANRYKINPDTNWAVRDEVTHEPVALPPEEVKAKAVPIAQLVYQAALLTGLLDGKPEKYFLVSDTVTNQETQRDLFAVEAAMQEDWELDYSFVRPNAPGIEGEMCNLIAGSDNNYSWLNTVGRNPQTFGDYKVDRIMTRPRPYSMVIELVKKEAGGA
ncbi:hypothetical protein HYALB_00000622 [Hymenoscyphus albidus]|uniref:Uncharacterized protein n=1 Tax=Hymenoscyphus albidus TaxID=595503 RepID=A0A9N9LYN1_9HELO|nr:hypothetical protein HYALB_00000622 [Hymenoscyphus albidus]